MNKSKNKFRHKWDGNSKHGYCEKCGCIRDKWGLSYTYKKDGKGLRHAPECVDINRIKHQTDEKQ